MRLKPAIVSALLLFCLAVTAPAQSAASQSAVGSLREGLELFQQGEYRQAIQSFRDVIVNPQLAAYKPDAYFWIARSYMALNQLEEAERNLEFYLDNYKGHPSYPEALYQKGRLLFLQGEMESAIQALEGFRTRYPQSPFVANAYFWIGEALYSLGRLDEAARVFDKVVQDYPTSFKVEAARYRRSLIAFKKRENELLKLLKWSHEESLKTVEEFQRREKAYEQAISSYQSRLAELRQGAEQSHTDAAELEKARQDKAQLLSQVADLRSQVADLRGQIAALQSAARGAGARDEQAAAAARQAAAAAEKAAAESEQARRTMELLRVKEEALAVKEQVLQKLLQEAGVQ